MSICPVRLRFLTRPIPARTLAALAGMALLTILQSYSLLNRELLPQTVAVVLLPYRK